MAPKWGTTPAGKPGSAFALVCLMIVSGGSYGSEDLHHPTHRSHPTHPWLAPDWWWSVEEAVAGNDIARALALISALPRAGAGTPTMGVEARESAGYVIGAALRNNADLAVPDVAMWRMVEQVPACDCINACVTVTPGP